MFEDVLGLEDVEKRYEVSRFQEMFSRFECSFATHFLRTKLTKHFTKLFLRDFFCGFQGWTKSVVVFFPSELHLGRAYSSLELAGISWLGFASPSFLPGNWRWFIDQRAKNLSHPSKLLSHHFRYKVQTPKHTPRRCFRTLNRLSLNRFSHKHQQLGAPSSCRGQVFEQTMLSCFDQHLKGATDASALGREDGMWPSRLRGLGSVTSRGKKLVHEGI